MKEISTWEGTKLCVYALKYRLQNEGVGFQGYQNPKLIVISIVFGYSNLLWCLSICPLKVFCTRSILIPPGSFPFWLPRHGGTGREHGIREHSIPSEEPIVYREHLILPWFTNCSPICRNQLPRTIWYPDKEHNGPVKGISYSIWSKILFFFPIPKLWPYHVPISISIYWNT